MPADTPLFNVPRQLVKTLNRDLAVAGIPKTDDRGRTLDVRALRHSRFDQTMNCYTAPRLLDVHGAIDALPSLTIDGSVQSERGRGQATGMDAVTVRQFAPKTGKTSESWLLVDRTTTETGKDASDRSHVACRKSKTSQKKQAAVHC